MGVVEEILGVTEVKNRLTRNVLDKFNIYQVRWKGYYHKGHTTWEPEENLTNCEELLNEFKIKQSKQKKYYYYILE